jgi:hydrogenase expression/formation protein HypD
MKCIEECRDGKLARGLAVAIRQTARDDRDYQFMEFCGGHTRAISRFGKSDLPPSNVRMIHGPGRPVCVLPTGKSSSLPSVWKSHRRRQRWSSNRRRRSVSGTSRCSAAMC